MGTVRAERRRGDFFVFRVYRYQPGNGRRNPQLQARVHVRSVQLHLVVYGKPQSAGREVGV